MAGEQVLASLREVAQRVAQAAVAAGRDPGEVALLLATKTVPAATILIALRAGYRLIGENRVQELVEKAAELDSVPHEAHFIGHLQKNKINQVVRHATCIQSLDSVELTEQVAARVQPDRAPLDVFVQVNTSGELSKYGCRPPDARAVVEQVAASAALRLRGFMTIGLFSEDAAAVRDSYRRLREVRDSIAALGIAGAEHAHELSMGMSGDFALAIAEGATMVRVGTAVFGARATSDPYRRPGQLSPR